MYLRDRSETATNFRVLISPDTKYVEHRESLHELLSTVERGKIMHKVVKTRCTKARRCGGLT